jgi:hypothetical protein
MLHKKDVLHLIGRDPLFTECTCLPYLIQDAHETWVITMATEQRKTCMTILIVVMRRT